MGIQKNKAFTIIELLIVIVIIGILVTITAVAYNNITQKAEFASLQSNTKNIETQIELYKSKNGTYPTSITSCPTPSPTEICVKTPEGVDMDYEYLPRGSTGGYAGVVLNEEGSYRLSLMGAREFLYSSKGESRGNNEFMQHVDMAPYIDKYGLKKYDLSLSARSLDISKNDTVNIYAQNGSTTKYNIGTIPIKLTETIDSYNVSFTPSLNATSTTQAMMAFYGTYSTGNIPIISNVRFHLAQ